ncbi:MAG: peptide chain release factor 1 [Thermoleophilia bacterium]|nr:peptide chain release factor 1 [Thermoleophilia bacterium]
MGTGTIIQMEPLVAEIERSFAHVERELNNPEVFGDPKRAAELGRQHKRLKAAYDLAQQWRELKAAIAEANEMFDDSEEEIRLMAREQKQGAEAELLTVEEALRLAMVEPDPNDGSNVIVEIRPGAGGDEAALWTGDLFDMYLKFCERQPAAKAEIISVTYSDAGGYKEAFISVKGDDAWQLLKWESGVHRVQRVPVTESQGRIHRSTASVVVRPEVEEIEVVINPTDLKIDVFRATGPGGQSVNTTDSAVRITHLPSGLVVSCQNEKSQHQNRDSALRVLRTRLYELEQQKAQDALSAQRKSAIGTGDRAEKIRTYNFAEDRVTDHRIGLTLYKMKSILQGDLGDVVNALASEEKRQKLEESSDPRGPKA